AAMHEPVERDTRMSSRISPSIDGNLPRHLYSMKRMQQIPWLPLGWMAFILLLGSDAGSADRTGRLLVPVLRLLFPAASSIQLDALHALVRKGGHVAEYGILVGLWFRALTLDHGIASTMSAWLAWLIAAGWAVIDERFQSTVASRN